MLRIHSGAYILTAFFFWLTLFSCQPRPKWEPIFNGRDLSGWQMKITGCELGDNYKNTFRVSEGKLIVSYEDYDTFDQRFGHLFFMEPLSHYRLRLEYRFVGEQVPGAPDWAYKNSGIKFHSVDPALLPKDQQLLVAIEAQLLGGNGQEERPTGNVCTAGTHIVMADSLITQHCTFSTSETYHDSQWVRAEIEVHGSERVIHKINGEEVLQYAQPQLDSTDAFARNLLAQGFPKILSEGYIALQAESHPVEFRKIELLRLEK
jgi:hypothetical protein